jgi:hypothetical protein
MRSWDLAIGIRDNGQLDPIELDVDGAIGEGRNRYAACRWLGIEPWCVTLPAETDWFVRVIERNLNRRHATAGARAVALVRAAGSRGTSLRNLGRGVRTESSYAEPRPLPRRACARAR